MRPTGATSAAVIVSTTAGDVFVFRAAVMLLVPTPAPIARPVLLTVATEVVAEFQLTVLLMLAVLLSL